MTALRAWKHWPKAGVVIGLALGATLGVGGVANAYTDTAPADAGFVVNAGRLVLSTDGVHYTGAMPVTIRNTSHEEVPDATITLAVPAGLRLLDVAGGLGCTGGAAVSCSLGTFGAGEQRSVAVSFASYAGPEHFARVTERGTVTVTSSGQTPDGRASDKYAGILQSQAGSVRHPRPYQPATAYDLALRSGGSPVVTRDADGVHVRVPLVAQDRTDAVNDGALVGVAVDGLDGAIFPSVDPPQPCSLLCPVPSDGWLAKGETQRFALLFSLPATTAAGTYHTQVHGDMNAGTPTPPADLTPQNNTVAFAVTVPAA